MQNVNSVLADLKKRGNDKYRNTLARHGMPIDRILGVSVADLKIVPKSIKGRQELACELYETGLVEAMYLAGLTADGSQMTKNS